MVVFLLATQPLASVPGRPVFADTSGCPSGGLRSRVYHARRWGVSCGCVLRFNPPWGLWVSAAPRRPHLPASDPSASESRPALPALGSRASPGQDRRLHSRSSAGGWWGPEADLRLLPGDREPLADRGPLVPVVHCRGSGPHRGRAAPPTPCGSRTDGVPLPRVQQTPRFPVSGHVLPAPWLLSRGALPWRKGLGARGALSEGH